MPMHIEYREGKTKVARIISSEGTSLVPPGCSCQSVGCQVNLFFSVCLRIVLSRTRCHAFPFANTIANFSQAAVLKSGTAVYCCRVVQVLCISKINCRFYLWFFFILNIYTILICRKLGAGSLAPHLCQLFAMVQNFQFRQKKTVWQF